MTRHNEKLISKSSVKIHAKIAILTHQVYDFATMT